MKQSAMKFSMRIESEASNEELLFAKQLGLNYVFTWVKEHQRSYEALLALRQKVETAGLTLYNTGSFDLGKSDKIHLGLPGRDEVIEEFKTFIYNLGLAGIHTTTFTWEPSQVWSSEPGESRGAAARRVDLHEMMQQPMTHGREYSEVEIWQNFEYFIKRILPIAEEADVRLALHPNDPPAKSLGGIPCLIHSFEDYKRAFAIAGDSPYLGMEFCTGCWLEGGDDFGNMLEAIRYFHERKKIFIVHFRNVSDTLPVFTETFLDNGYMDMYQVMKTFCEIGYDGTMTLDHTPKFVPGFDKGSGTAYAIGYMRALMERAEAEL
ncbi:D-mannonate dehydratase [candidate division KSB3 bacterium]|uniref:mannonate dehydratase n=1 Tax=candidate division KSB3 bacterium TaxID=2044937 RepID=A0A2G6KJW1_9BACT|nr:MAG: D-mannonate dehydratase [candidate division KSB3 bacterium]